MTSIRKLLFFVMAMTLAAFALPATAAKVYTLNLVSSPSPLAVGSAGTVTATMNNISDDVGNSTIKSFKLFAANGITITAPASGAMVALGNGYTATIQNNGNSIFVSNINIPLKPFGTPLVLSMTVNVSCSATGGAWTIQGPWNGGSFTGQTFLQNPPSNLTTGVAGACTYSTAFLNQPKTTFAGYPITTTAFNNPQGNPIQVQLTQNGGAPPTTLVTLTSSCTLAGNSASTNASGVATFSALSSAVGTGCTLTASFVTSSATSASFDIVAPAGTLGCTDTNNFAGTEAYDPNGNGPFMGAPGFALRRHVNLDGSCPFEIPYIFTFDPDNDAWSFIADKLGQEVIVEYVLVFKPSATVNGWPPARRPKFAYGPGLNNPPVFPGEYIDGLACSNDLVDSTSLPPIPPVPPYDTAAFSQYTPAGSPAQMCAAQLGWTSVDVGFVQFWLRVIDADGFGKFP